MGLVAYTDFLPRTQQRFIFNNRRRFTVLVCHRRFGKTMLAAELIIRLACANQRKWPPPRYGYIAPYRYQVKRAAWDYVKHAAGPFLARPPNETDLRVELLNGATVELYGADNYEGLRGSYLDGLVLDEYGDIARKAVTEVLRPQLADYLGWMFILGTPKGRNQFEEAYVNATQGFLVDEEDPESDRVLDDEWAAFMFRASETGIIDPGELRAAARDMSQDEYNQEFECSFTAAIVGAYYAKLIAAAEREDRIRPGLPVDPVALVHTAWDLGYSDDTAIWWFQKVGREYRFIDYYQNSGHELAHYRQVLAERREERGYTYGQHLLPHDAKAHELGTGKTREEQLAEMQLQVDVVDRHKVEDGVAEVRRILPMAYFDARRCRDGIEALSHYRREWVEEKGVFKPKPLHDWASHGADAMRTAAMGVVTGDRGEFEEMPLPNVVRV